MFFRLALRNIKKNYNRSMLAICGMVVAAAVLTGGGAFAQLYPERGYFGFRQGAGGDIVAFPGLITFDERRVNDRSLGWRMDRSAGQQARMSTHDVSPRAMLVPAGPPAEPFRLDTLPQSLTSADFDVYPYLSIPVTIKYRDARTGAPYERAAELRGRIATLDLERYDMARAVTKGRYLGPLDAGANVAVVNAPPMNQMMMRSAVAGLTGFDENQELAVEVPTIAGVRDGQLIYDFGRTRQYRFATVGLAAMKTNVEPLRDENGEIVFTESPRRTISQQMYWDRAELFIPRETWERVYSEVSGGMPVYTGMLGIVVRDAPSTKGIVTRLGQTLPGTVIAVPDLVAAQDANQDQVVLPRDATTILNILAYLISGLLMAANMHVLISQRQAEIGVLKAIGVGMRDIFTLTMLEIAGFAVIGGLVGFAVVTAMLWLVGYWSSGVSTATGLALTLHSFARVMGFTVIAAMIFGVAPALRATRATTVSALRSE